MTIRHDHLLIFLILHSPNGELSVEIGGWGKKILTSQVESITDNMAMKQ